MFETEFLKYVRSGQPVITVRTSEESRCYDALHQVARHHYGRKKHAFAYWNLVDGWSGDIEELPKGTASLDACIERLEKVQLPGLYVLGDVDSSLRDPLTIRRLRNFNASQSNTGRHIILISQGTLPADLLTETTVVDFPLPGQKEIETLLENILEDPKLLHLSQNIDRGKVSLALRGLSERTIKQIFCRMTFLPQACQLNLLEEIYAEKKQEVSKASDGILEFVPPKLTSQSVGGLHNVKNWLAQRKNFFCNPEYARKGKVPKALLVMGISGCGKSLLVKTISFTWETPLFRLRMGKVFSGGESPEHRFLRAIQLLENIAPVILWLDEFEKIFPGMDSGLDAQAEATDSRIFSEFLTWMEEKTSQVFVAATCNRIAALPAEVIRKGRFDEVFFVDLPCDPERLEILRIHIQKYDLEPEVFDLHAVVSATAGWSGAELEELVSSAVIEAMAYDVPLTDELLIAKAGETIPLSRTSEEQISKLQKWALFRATPASKFSSLGKKKKALNGRPLEVLTVNESRQQERSS